MKKIEVDEVHAMTALYALRLALQQNIYTSHYEIESAKAAIEEFKVASQAEKLVNQIAKQQKLKELTK